MEKSFRKKSFRKSSWKRNAIFLLFYLVTAIQPWDTNLLRISEQNIFLHDCRNSDTYQPSIARWQAASLHLFSKGQVGFFAAAIVIAFKKKTGFELLTYKIASHCFKGCALLCNPFHSQNVGKGHIKEVLSQPHSPSYTAICTSLLLKYSSNS